MLVADEGVDTSIVDALRADGHVVKYFAEAGSAARSEFSGQVKRHAGDVVERVLMGPGLRFVW